MINLFNVVDIVLFIVCNYFMRVGVENEGGYIGEDEVKRYCGIYFNWVWYRFWF